MRGSDMRGSDRARIIVVAAAALAVGGTLTGVALTRDASHAVAPTAALRHAGTTASPMPAVPTDPPGPLAVTLVGCGALTPAQQGEFHTNATAGAVVRVANVSNDLTATFQVSVEFTAGATVDQANVTGDVAPLAPGQSELAEVDDLGAPGDACDVTSYQVWTPGTLDDLGTYHLDLHGSAR